MVLAWALKTIEGAPAPRRPTTLLMPSVREAVSTA